MKIRKTLCILALILLMCVSLVMPAAASSDSPWASAYLDICTPYADKSNESIYPEFGCSDYYFYLIQMDGDNVPELVVNANGYWIEIYTFDGSKAVMVDNMSYGLFGRYYWCYEGTGLIESYCYAQLQDADGAWGKELYNEYYMFSGSDIKYMGDKCKHYNEKLEYVSTTSSLPAGFTPDESGEYIEFSGSDDHAMTVEAAVKMLGDYTAATCVPSTQKLIVNGSEVQAEIYNIGGYNYFKLRDLAALSALGPVPFDVGYDSATATVSMTNVQRYQPIGGELTPGKDNSASCVLSAQKVLYYINPQKTRCEQLNLTAYNIGGYNFFKLRDIVSVTESFDQLDYDAATNTVLLHTLRIT